MSFVHFASRPGEFEPPNVAQRLILLFILGSESRKEFIHLGFCQSHALTHAGVIFIPLANIIVRRTVVPRHTIQLHRPRPLDREDSDFFNDFKSDFSVLSHGIKPFLALAATLNFYIDYTIRFVVCQELFGFFWGSYSFRFPSWNRLMLSPTRVSCGKPVNQRSTNSLVDCFL